MTNTNTMEFEATGSKTGSVREMKNKVSDNYLSKVSSSRIVWHLVKRHKFGLVATWAVFITITYMFPPVWDILGSLVS